MRNLIKTLFFFSVFIFLAFAFQVKSAYAATSFGYPPEGAITCSCEGSQPSLNCANGTNNSSGACGINACEGGDSWIHYSLNSTCYSLSLLEKCHYWYIPDFQACSIGDKCGANGPPAPYLQAGDTCGNCTPPASSFYNYKTCCNGSSLSGSCIQYGADNTPILPTNSFSNLL